MEDSFEIPKVGRELQAKKSRMGGGGDGVGGGGDGEAVGCGCCSLTAGSLFDYVICICAKSARSLQRLREKNARNRCTSAVHITYMHGKNN